MSFFSSKRNENDLSQLITSALSAEICEACKGHTVEAEVEQLRSDAAMLKSVRDGKERYRNTLAEFLSSLEGKLETAGIHLEREKETLQSVESSKRAISSTCAIAIGKAQKLHTPSESAAKLPMPSARSLRERLKTETETARTLGSELSIAVHTAKCRLCSN